jgi:hypothetical protein
MPGISPVFFEEQMLLPNLIAVSDPVEITLVIVEALIGVATIWAMIWLSRLSHRQDEQDKLKDRLESQTEQSVEQKFKAVKDSLEVQIKSLATMLEKIEGRLGKGDDEFDAINDRDHELELKTLLAVQDVKNYVVQNAASKDDLRGHQETTDRKLEGIVSQLSKHSTALGIIGSQVNAMPCRTGECGHAGNHDGGGHHAT